MNWDSKVRFFQYIGTRSLQQDAYLIDQDKGIFIICDGIGSNAKSGYYATSFVNAFALFLKTNNDFTDYDSFLSKFNRDFCKSQSEDLDLKNLGTTLAFTHIRNGKLVVGHLGDSKVIVTIDGKIHYESKDHSMYNDLAPTLDYNQITTLSPSIKNQITKFVSINYEVHIPEVIEIPLDDKHEYFVFIATDGVTDLPYFYENEFLKGNVFKNFEELKAEASQKSKDNATAIIYQFTIQNKLAFQEIILMLLILIFFIFSGFIIFTF